VTAIDLTADLFFVSALRAAADSSFTRLLPLADLREPLAPHPRFAQRMLLALQSVDYIRPELSQAWASDWLSSRDWAFAWIRERKLAHCPLASGIDGRSAQLG